MQNTAYPKATGGTPIISWIPNQLNAVLKTMEECFNILPEKYIKDITQKKNRFLNFYVYE